MATDENVWKRKLKAYLHDPPCKAMDIREHERIAASFLKAEFPEDERFSVEAKQADHLASSIDRFPFPQGVASSFFDGKHSHSFRHPFMSSDDNWYKVDLKTVPLYEEALHNAVKGIQGDVKQKFYLYWRRWREESVLQNMSELAFFPADTRIPDHSIWTHLDVTSALQGCFNLEKGKIEPAFLIFQAGPVQSFVAAARSTRDLWSGSYMLSWLTGNAIKAVTDECGPDSIIFPALRGNGIFDILNKEDIYDKISFTGKAGETETLWDRLYGKREEMVKTLTNPTLPNRFFAVVPAWKAKELAQNAENAFRKELERISERCLAEFQKHIEKKEVAFDESWAERWRKQVALHPEITWQVYPADTDIETILEKAVKLPGQDSLTSQLNNVKKMIEFATVKMPVAERDERYYADASKTRLKSWGIAWALNYAQTEHRLAARRNTRDFLAFQTDDFQAGAPKDALTGMAEVIGTEELWKEKLRAPKGQPKDDVRWFFNYNEKCYGALSIIKRIWCASNESYLLAKLGISREEFKKAIRFDSVLDVAEKNRRGRKENGKSSSPYVAVIALDGDEMGKWLSGEKAPQYKYLLAGNALEYFKANGYEDIKRSLTPSWHLQFSEALSNFSNYIAEKVVDTYDGQLIYAGGDDVIAMLPADQALECACALRGLFRGDWKFLEECVPGYSKLKQQKIEATQNGFVEADSKQLLVPGCDADVSCGIAVAHCKYPLQNIVAEARKAETRAKTHHGRGAVAVSLLKRSGEIIHWGTKWNSGAVELYNQYNALCDMEGEEAPGKRFPYALAALLDNYGLDKGQFVDGFDVKGVLLQEFDHVLSRQMANVPESVQKELRDKAEHYLDQLLLSHVDGKDTLADFGKLFLVAAFIERNREDL
ncbi:MAG: type III-B CRISPR-associated protein Cas10/Cmr2 [Victivallales bacterium]|nr:type III-B CRISPR-associated protein Cas10/Cmr2 [Victivallales bacterium]